MRRATAPVGFLPIQLDQTMDELQRIIRRKLVDPISVLMVMGVEGATVTDEKRELVN